MKNPQGAEESFVYRLKRERAKSFNCPKVTSILSEFREELENVKKSDKREAIVDVDDKQKSDAKENSFFKFFDETLAQMSKKTGKLLDSFTSMTEKTAKKFLIGVIKFCETVVDNFQKLVDVASGITEILGTFVKKCLEGLSELSGKIKTACNESVKALDKQSKSAWVS
jgi:type II secretory pathway component PulF